MQQQQLHNYFHDASDPVVRQALSIIQNPSYEALDVLAAMSRAPHDMVVQEKGCERLWVLSWEEENAAVIGRAGGVTMILAAMSRFPMNCHLQQCGCESLQNLSTQNANRREICQLSGVYIIVQAMLRHPTVAGIQQCGCTALASIASGDSPYYQQAVQQAAGLNAVLNAARSFCGEESVIEAANDALTAMGFDTSAYCDSSSSSYDDYEDDEHMATPSADEEKQQVAGVFMEAEPQETRSIVCMDL